MNEWYGGTKQEMERLLADAQKISGVKYDISSYADIVDAIHVVQTQMGITGTTAKEASETIQGSVAATKSAYKNLVTGLADENANIDLLVNNLVESGVTALDNIIPRIQQIFDTLPKVVEKILPKFPPLLEKLLPPLLKAVMTLIQQVVKILPQSVGMVTGFLINEFVPSILNVLPEVITAGMEIIFALIEGVADALPSLIPQIVDIVILMVNTLLSSQNIVRLVNAAISIIGALAQGLIKGIPTLLKALPQIISNIVSGLAQGVGRMAEVGLNLIKGLWSGIQNAKQWLLNKISGFVDGVVDGIKNFFGIHSPSKVIEDEVGIFVGEGVGTGMLQSVAKVMKNVKAFGQKVTAGLSDAINPNIGDINARVNASVKTRRATSTGTASAEEEKRSKTVIINQTNNYSKAHSRYELYKAKQDTAAAVRLAMAGG